MYARCCRVGSVKDGGGVPAGWLERCDVSLMFSTQDMREMVLTCGEQEDRRERADRSAWLRMRSAFVPFGER